MDNKEKRLIFIFNATPLIHFGKSGLAWMIEKLNGEKYIPPTVYKEVVVTGKNKGFEDAPIIENLIHRKVITIKEPKKDILTLITKGQKDIHMGEAEVLALAKELNATAIVDDPVARKIADIYNIKKEGSYTIIIRMLLKGQINKEEAKESIDKLIASGWRCDIDFYRHVLKLIERQPTNNL